jgi:hypothetical protein
MVPRFAEIIVVVDFFCSPTTDAALWLLVLFIRIDNNNLGG